LRAGCTWGSERISTMNAVTRLAAMLSGGRVSLLAMAAAALLAGCGGDDPTIPADRGDQLLTRLDEVEGAVAAGNCEGAQDSADLFVAQVDELPAEVDDEVKRLLRAGGERLQELATERCEEPTPTGPSGEEGFVPPPEEETTTPATTSSTTSTEQEEPPPDDEGDDGGGNQGGSGGDGGGSGGDGGGSGGDGGGNQGGGTGTGGVGGGGD
jgi:uncharacterized membrane protein YgcG